MSAQIIDGRVVSAAIKEQIKRRISKLYFPKFPNMPRLVLIKAGDDQASAIYVHGKQKACEEVGVSSLVCCLPEQVNEQELLKVIIECNQDDTVHGILVQLPLPPHIDKLKILSSIKPEKDVDCFHPENCGLLIHNRPRFRPCTPAGILELFGYYGITTKGQNITIVNRSMVVGQPLAVLLTQQGDATATVCHEHTENIDSILWFSDIIITAVGNREKEPDPKKKFILTADMVKEGVVVVDVGISRIGNKIIGDADFEEVSKKASWITPVPGGVGPMTVAMLLWNTLEAAERIVQ